MRRSPLAFASAAWVAMACGETVPRSPREFTLVTEAYEPGALFSIWAAERDDVWLVGGEQGRPVVLRFDGQGWTRNDPPVRSQLWWVHGFQDGPVFVAGEAGTLARWMRDGGWETFDAGFRGTTFYGIWGAAPDDVWAVGGPYRNVPEADRVGDVLLHFDGADWSRVSVPVLDAKPSSAERDLFKVWGTARDNVFVVGSSGLVLRFDGSAWTAQDTGLGRDDVLFTVFGRGANDVWAVGGLGSPVLIRFDGSTWASVDLPAETPGVVQGLWTAPGEAVHISGYDGFIASLDDDGWLVSTPPTDLAFHGLFGEGGALWAAGGNITSASPDYVAAVAVSGRQVIAP